MNLPARCTARPNLVWLLGVLLTAMLAIPQGVAAQNAHQWITNYYRVSGTTLPEIRRSIRESRPWKDREETDGFTDWQVHWRFSVTATPDGCRCSTFNSQTRIVITMPLWTPPTNAPTSVVQIWTNYFSALLRHEVGHGQMALAAAAEIHRRVKEQSSGANCESLKQSLNQIGQTVVAEYRQRDKEYDVKTQHGATQGARMPGRMRRERP